MLVKGTIEKRTYNANKYGKKQWWMKLVIKVKGKPLSILGESDLVPSIGDYVIANGELKIDPKWGEQFKAKRLSFLDPQEKDAITDRLSEFDLLEHDESEKLSRMGPKLWQMIESKTLEHPEIEKLWTEFQKWKKPKDDLTELESSIIEFFEKNLIVIEPRHAKRIASILGYKALNIITGDVTALCGIMEWEIIEPLAKRMKVSDNLFLEGQFLSQLFEICKDGKHLCFPKSKFDEEDEEEIDRLIERGRIINYEGYLYPTPHADSEPTIFDMDADEDEFYDTAIPKRGYWDIEYKTAKNIKLLLECPKEEVNEERFEELSKGLSEGQKEAFKKAVVYPFSLIQGMPGTGKSRLIAVISRYFDEENKLIHLAAPTGKAAKVMRMYTGRNATTIHSWIFKKTDPVHVAIIDESSMIDSLVMYHIFNSRLFQKIIMLGDMHQLSPVSSGSPYISGLLSEKIPTTYLTENFRFKDSSPGILVILNKILKNRTSNLEEVGEGVKFIFTNNIMKRNIKIAKSLDKFDVDHTKFISVTNKETDQLCDVLRDIFNPSDDEERPPFSANDWILYTKNDIDKGLSNGDVGRIISMNKVIRVTDVHLDGKKSRKKADGMEIIVDIDGKRHMFENTSNMKLVYSSNTYKSQGSEAETAVISIFYPSRLLCRQMIYTAISRAKKEAIIIAPNIEIIKKCINTKEPERYSKLKDLIIREDPIEEFDSESESSLSDASESDEEIIPTPIQKKKITEEKKKILSILMTPDSESDEENGESVDGSKFIETS